MNGFITFAFVSIVLGSFYTALFSPQERSEDIMKQAHVLYVEASDSDDVNKAQVLLKRVEELVHIAKRYAPHNKTLHQEYEFFKSAQIKKDNDEVYLSDITSDVSIK